jgi:hypothetical protein
MMRRWRAGALTLGCMMVLAGCGSGGSQHRSATATSTTPSTSTPATSSTAPAPTNEASKPAEQILTDAAAALRAAHGYAMRGTIMQGRQRLRLKLSTTSAAAIHLAVAFSGATVEEIGLPTGSYIRGNTTFWRSQAGAHAARFSNRWIQVPSRGAQSITSSLGTFAPTTLSRCLLEDHGTLSIAGKATIDGHLAILLQDAGDSPGSSPGTLAVAATGAPYPLRYTVTGGQRAGGHIDECNDGKATDARGTLTFSQYGEVPPIQAPAGAEPPPTGSGA